MTTAKRSTGRESACRGTPARFRQLRTPGATFLGTALAIALAGLAPAASGDGETPEIVRSHALAIHGKPRYPADFEHLEYVNPDAPKGGEIRLAVQGTFDSFNPWIPKGSAFGSIGAETLTSQPLDDPSVEYGLIARSIEVPADRSWVIFELRPEARWHDGRPITAHDVKWSFETLKTKGRPFYRFYYGNVTEAEVLGEHRIKFSFNERNNRELPVIMGQLTVLPRHYWQDRDFENTSLEPPLTSGPYRIKDFEPGRFVVLERVDDYWGRDLPLQVGTGNFDRIRYDYYRDDTVIRQALKAGEVDYRDENSSKAWALSYDTPAVRKGWLRKELIPHHRPTGMQGFVMNTRRELFADPRVREALGLAFDFEWTNERLFYGQYVRTESYYSNSALAATGLPQGEELAILEPYRGRVPPEVFTRVYEAPRTDGSGWPRDNLRRAFELLAEAGWRVRDFELVHEESGQPFVFEFLLYGPSFERVVLPYARNLARLGIGVEVRVVDRSQYINRIRSFDYDMLVNVWGESESPGNEQRDYWSSAAADSPAARNLAGIRDPVVDELIEQLIVADSRESLIAHCRALDRVLLWGHYVVPNWHSRSDRILFWDKFSRPAITPLYGTSIDVWWYDEEKAAKLAASRGRG